MANLTTYYNTLQLGRDASDAAIKRAYRTRVQKFHPDKNPGDTERALKNMLRLNEAYEVLSDPVRRADYDALIASRERALAGSNGFAQPWGAPPTGQKPATGQPPKPPFYPPSYPPYVSPQAPSQTSAIDALWLRLAPLLQKPALWLAILAVVACAWLWAWRDGPMPLARPARTAATVQPTSPALAPLTAEALQARQLAQAVADIEARHPALNPRLPGYRKDLVEQAKTRARAYTQQGMAVGLALQQAVRDMELAAATTNPHSPQITPGALNVQQRLAISVACGDPEPSMDMAAYQACARNTLLRQRLAAGKPGSSNPAASQ